MTVTFEHNDIYLLRCCHMTFLRLSMHPHLTSSMFSLTFSTTVIYENVFRRAYIRGVLNRNRWSVRVSPNAVNRMIEAAKGVLLHFLCDVFITSDSRSTAKLGR